MTKSLKDILIRNVRIKVNGSLWLESDNGRFFGPGPVELLERIAETGSISMAAKEMGMSYKKAWGLINELNSQTANPVVLPQAGGEKGGGSAITPQAMELIKYHRLLRKRFAEFLEKETKRLKI
ncbi:MAG: LysR family transcriptional regulator [Mucilaginibacter sp.]|nr:LysR family transcriptional regulator [Mucilaginibacter sp.]